MTRSVGLRADDLKKEYHALMQQMFEIRQQIKDQWLTASVQQMREWEQTLSDCDSRIATIKRARSWSGE